MATITVMPAYTVHQFDGMATLRDMFPTGEADDLNLAFFSTSGVHGDYTTIEEIEAGKDDMLTVLVIRPRIVFLGYGHIKVSPADIPWLKRLRESSWAVAARIGSNA